MAPPTPQTKSAHEKWLDTVNQADAAWNEYDRRIIDIVTEFNLRLKSQDGHGPNLDWHLVKAMLWVESGGPTRSAWKTRPMQIGNPQDPGLKALLGNKEGGDVILTKVQRETIGADASTADTNLLAGIAYVLMRAAKFAHESVPSATDNRIHEVTVKPGDSLDRIARANGTTIAVLEQMNPAAKAIIRPNEVLKYRKASIQRVIKGWHTIDSSFVADKYNVGDKLYKAKIDHCLGLIATPLPTP